MGTFESTVQPPAPSKRRYFREGSSQLQAAEQAGADANLCRKPQLGLCPPIQRREGSGGPKMGRKLHGGPGVWQRLERERRRDSRRVGADRR